MFYFNEKKHNFWSIYTCIQKYYPTDSVFGEIDSFYNSYPGLAEKQRIIAEGIYDSNVFKKNWSDFTGDISDKTGQQIIGTTSGITSCYSAKMELEKTALADLTRTRELHFFVSLLGPFYTIIGLDKNELALEDNFYQSTNLLVVSPEKEYKEWFIYIANRIEEQFKNYRFVTFFICRQVVNCVSLKFRQNNSTVFHALFNTNLNLNVNTIGDESYQSGQWAINENETPC